MIDGMFQAGTDSALDDQVQRPAPFKPDEPKFSLGQVARAPFQGVASGATKSAGFAAEIAGAFGDVMGAGGFNAGGMFSAPTPDERKQQADASRRLLEMGPQYSNPAGDLFRQRAKEMMPDPTQTHAAAQIVAGVSEFATQAVGYAAMGGPVGPALLAGDAALAESDKLKQEGVPLGARSAAGAVAGAVAGVSVALPVVGKTVAKTAALVVAGGPGGFIAQNAAERAILENAGYDKLASQYDPLDPVGLALSSVVPAVFGGVALRARAKAPVSLKDVVLGIESNGQRFGKDGKVLTSPKGAKGEMQVMDGTNLDPGFGVRPAADDSLAERARVGSDYLDAMLKRYGTEDKAMAAYNAGPGAVDKALAKGGDWLKSLPAETQAYVTKGMKKLEGGRTTEAARAVITRDPEAVAAARVSQTAQVVDSFRLTPDSDLAGMTRHVDAMESAHDMLARGEKVEVSDIVKTPDYLEIWHGSPHEFNAFDSAHIGKGEGAQAFGRGLYFAEREGVARFYQEVLSRPQDSLGSISKSGRNDVAKTWIETFGGDRAKAEANYREFRDSGFDPRGQTQEQIAAHRAEVEEVASAIANPPGHIYKTRIAIDAATRMLDSDATLAQQNPRVLSAIDSLHPGLPRDMTGASLIKQFGADAGGRLEAELQAAGITGIKFLDGASRDGKGDSRNYVIFPGNESMLSIAERNGKKLEAFIDGLRKAFEPPPQPRPPPAAPAAEPRTGAADAPAKPTPPPKEGAGTPEAKQSAALESQSAEIAAIDPDMMVQLEGREPMKVSELLDQVKAEAKEDAQEASFVEAAVNCLLRNE